MRYSHCLCECAGTSETRRYTPIGLCEYSHAQPGPALIGHLSAILRMFGGQYPPAFMNTNEVSFDLFLRWSDS